jgi:hypothetical protein
LIGESVLMTWAVNIARFSVIPAIVMHAAFNTVTRFLNGLFAGTEPRASLPFELVFAVSGLVVAAVLVGSTRGRLAYHPGAYLADVSIAAQRAAVPDGRTRS